MSAAAARPVSVPTWTEQNRQWLLAAIARLRQRLEAQGGTAGEIRPFIPAGFTPSLDHAAQVFGLSCFERELLLLVAGLELDYGLRAAVTALNGGTSPHTSYGLALAVLTDPHWDAISADAPLRRWHLVEPGFDAGLTEAALRIDERVLHFLAGIPATDPVLAGLARTVPAGTGVHEDDRPLVVRIARLLAWQPERGPVVVLRGSEQDAAERRDFALAAADQAARRPLWIDARDLPPEADALLRLAGHLDREAALTGALPVIALDGSGGESAALGLVARLQGAILWLGPASSELAAMPRGARVLRFDLPPPDAARTRAGLLARWHRMAPPAVREDLAVRAELDRAGRQFHLGAAALDDVVERLRTAEPAERAAWVWPAAREAARGGLETITQRIEARAGFDDVVLPAGQSAMLRDIARHLRQRERVYRDWGFGAKHQLGQGLVALFAGESGTGKTLAAEAIANEVRLDLYRIDLATIVSKYIGETEKNLKRLFDAAETTGAVLLFDEADALFGKRTDVKDSHDRHANIEVAYLLQRIEAYRGLAILTTNMKSAVDRAFLRRIRFVVTFPLPDAAAREQIWRRQFPGAAPLGPIDFTALARLNLPGANIRNIAVNAAFKAADSGGCIDQALLITAAREEFAKLERPFTDMEGRSGR